MYQVMGWKALAGISAALTLIIFGVWWFVATPVNAWDYFSIGLRSITIAITVLAFLGETVPLIPWVASWAVVQKFFPTTLPHLDGQWRAKLTSNWPTIAKAHKLPDGADGPIFAQVRIKVRLFTLRVELTSDTKYSESKTEAVRVLRNLDDGDIRLHYIYWNDSPEAKETDSGNHRGAASLKLKRPDGAQPFLEGHYWTNRNWEKGLNTAGRIQMWRKGDPDSEAEVA